MPQDAVPRRPDSPGWRSGFGISAFLLGLLALCTPLLHGEGYGRIGTLLVMSAVLEIAHGFRRSTVQGQRAAWVGGFITMAMGLFLLNAPYFARAALIYGLAGWFALDGVRFLVGAFLRGEEKRSAPLWLAAAGGNLLVCAGLLSLSGGAAYWAVAVAAAVRILGTASNILLSPVFTPDDTGDAVVSSLGLPDSPEMREIAASVAQEESARASIDRGWIVGYIFTLFAIHIGRMGFDNHFLGVVSPVVAVLGDLLVALLLAFVFVLPTGGAWRWLTRRSAGRAWGWCLAVPSEQRGWPRRLGLVVLTRRLRQSMRAFHSRISMTAALSRGLKIGLPLAAIIAATVPVWGMSWYFDTENWAAGIWNSWAEARTDTWREAMVASLAEEEAGLGPDRAFAVSPRGATGDFSFVVIGDPGEGDASQHSLRASYLDVVRRPEVKFVLISSDVVYPTGAMKDYEACFWLPFMGTTKPVYAIPGNHDWYDALEGFAATFLQPAAARAAMRARVEVDNRLTSTTDRRIEQLIAQASRFRQLYQVPTQQQKAPFFQVRTESLALFAVDTGVARRVDETQRKWLDDGLASAKDKFKMVVLGHPLYSGGAYTTEEGTDFAALHGLLKKHNVEVVMAGDTHDLEYYTEPREGTSRVTHHFVNGGGGAYLSFGTALAWPADPASKTWAYYPSKRQVVDKVEETTRAWKRPAWWWTKKYGAWPFSAEWLSAMFDVNVAPFYQSFVEVRVEPSKRRVVYVPYGVHGRLRWEELDTSPDVLPASASRNSFVEWVVEM